MKRLFVALILALVLVGSANAQISNQWLFTFHSGAVEPLTLTVIDGVANGATATLLNDDTLRMFVPGDQPCFTLRVTDAKQQTWEWSTMYRCRSYLPQVIK